MATQPLQLQGTDKRSSTRRFLLGLMLLVALLGGNLFSSTSIRPAHAGGGLSVLYTYKNAGPNWIQPTFEIVNNSGAPVNLSTLTIRYWFTSDSNSPLVFSCFWAQAGCGNVTGSFQPFSPAMSNADSYLEVGFSGGAGTLADGQNSNVIQVGFHKQDWSNFDQTNDYSANLALTALGTNANIGLYQNGSLVSGNPPVTSSGGNPTTGITVLYANEPAAPNWIQPAFEIVNNSGAPVNLSTLTIRYWFTSDGSSPLVFQCFYAKAGCGNVTETLPAFSPPIDGADSYLEVAFSSGAGLLADGQNSDIIKVGIHKQDWSNFDLTNDYSTDTSMTALGTNVKIGLYQNGTLIAGSEPFTPPNGTPVSISVDATQSSGQIPSNAFGVNTPVFSSLSSAPGALSLAQQAGITEFRFPGGGTADVYDWRHNGIYTNAVKQVFPSNSADDRSNYAFFKSYADPGVNFDAFMTQVQSVNGTADIVVNYGSSTPQDAADWVSYANKNNQGLVGPVPTYKGAAPGGRSYGIKDWEIGNEVYGDGTYANPAPSGENQNGMGFEFNSKTLGPAAYAQGVIAYSQAMKAVDPTINIGAVFTAPGNNPDGGNPNWNSTILNTPGICTSIDYMSVHWYAQQPLHGAPGLDNPPGENDANLLQAPEVGADSGGGGIAAMVQSLKSQLQSACGSTLATHPIQIKITETNSVAYNPGKQSVSLVNAMFLDDDIMTWLEHGVTNVDWWALSNSTTGEEFRNATLLDANGKPAGVYVPANTDPSLFPTGSNQPDFGDFGLLSNGSCDAFAVAPNKPVCPVINGTQLNAGEPLPTYYGYAILAHLGAAGDTMVPVSSPNPLVTIHVVKQANGKLAIMVINKDPDTTYGVTFSLQGFSAKAGGATEYTFGQNEAANITATNDTPATVITTQQLPANGSKIGVSVAPYSTNVIVLS